MSKTKQIILTAFLTLTTNVPASEATTGSGSQLTLEDLRTFSDVFNQVRRNFAGEIDEHTLLDAAINGMISELDPHSAYLDVAQSRALENSSQGRYGGIGVRIEVSAGRLLVDEIFPGGPAALAGIRAGDLVTAVDGQPVRGRKLSESMAALRGEPGTSVNLRIMTGQEKPREIQLQREYIEVPSVESSLLEGEVAYFLISHFHRNTHHDMASEISRLQQSLNAPLNGIIIDVRNNSGGVLLPAVETADGFLEEGLIVYSVGRNPASRMEFRASPGQWAPDVPVVILVNANTASASEVLAAALQDNGRATVMGETTHGKGSIQSVFSLRNGSTLKLTTAHYYTPSGNTIHKVGVEPDVVVPATDRRRGMAGAIEKEDIIIQALEQLRLNATPEAIRYGSN